MSGVGYLLGKTKVAAVALNAMVWSGIWAGISHRGVIFNWPRPAIGNKSRFPFHDSE